MPPIGFCCGGYWPLLRFEFGVAELIAIPPRGLGETEGMLNGLMSSLKELPTLALFWSWRCGYPGAIVIFAWLTEPMPMFGLFCSCSVAYICVFFWVCETMLAEGVKYSFLGTLFWGTLVGVFNSLIIEDSSSIPSSSGALG